MTDEQRPEQRDPGDVHRLKPPDWFLSLDGPEPGRRLREDEQPDTDSENGTDD
jgi:hypothetical protein